MMQSAHLRDFHDRTEKPGDKQRRTASTGLQLSLTVLQG
jgi:hypothetical protein